MRVQALSAGRLGTPSGQCHVDGCTRSDTLGFPPQTHADLAYRAIDRERHRGSLNRDTVNGHVDEAAAEVVRILDQDRQRTSGTPDLRMHRAPHLRQARIDEQLAAMQPQTENTFHAQPPAPGRGAGVPAPAAAPYMGCDARHVRRKHVGLTSIVLRRGARGCAADRVDKVENTPRTIAVVEPGEGEAQPGGCMRVLATILADAGRIGLDVARVSGGLVKGRPKEPYQSLVVANEFSSCCLDSRSGALRDACA